MTSVRLTATQLRGSFYGYANIGVYSLSRLPSGKVDFVSINGEVNQAIQLQAWFFLDDVYKQRRQCTARTKRGI